MLARLPELSIWFHKKRGHKIRRRPWGSQGAIYVQCVCGRAWFL